MIQKTIFLTFLLLLFNITSEAQRSNQETTIFKVNIDCQNCVNRITNQLAFERGVRDLQFNLEEQTVAVTYRNNRTDKKILAEKIKELGFEVKEVKEKRAETE